LQYTWESETTSDPIVIAPGLGEKAANLAEEVVSAPYLSGGKGFDYDTMKFVDSATIKSGYRYWNAVKGQLDRGEGLDCSGLSFWAFNKAAGATKHQDPANPIYYEGASGQWADTERFKQISTTIPSVSDLNTGYLLFLFVVPRYTPYKRSTRSCWYVRGQWLCYPFERERGRIKNIRIIFWGTVESKWYQETRSI
jgi:hypothetical protein